jgi:hypothetical protein
VGSTFSEHATWIDTWVTGDDSGQMVDRPKADVVDPCTGDDRLLIRFMMCSDWLSLDRKIWPAPVAVQFPVSEVATSYKESENNGRLRDIVRPD